MTAGRLEPERSQSREHRPQLAEPLLSAGTASEIEFPESAHVPESIELDEPATI